MLFSRGLFFYWENFQRATFGPAMRNLGQIILKIGNNVQGEFLNSDRRNWLFKIFYIRVKIKIFLKF